MGPVLALLQPWHALVLIFISCVALILSLYCLLFTVPIRRFWRQVESLGGGLEGVRKHVEGVRADVSRRIDNLEQQLREDIEEERRQLREEMSRLDRKVDKETSSLSTRLEKAREKLQEMEEALSAVRSSVKDGDSDRQELSRAIQKLSERVEDLESDFDSIDMELRESISRRVSESHRQVEARVLSALDAIQDQILEKSGGLSAGPGTTSPPPSGGAWQTDEGGESGTQEGNTNIIAAEPLFSHLEEGEGEENQDDDGGTPDADE